MLVKELIAFLQKFPPGAHCIRSMCSETEAIEEDQIHFTPHDAPPGRLGLSSKTYEQRMVKRGPVYMVYDPKVWAADEKPEFVDVVNFGGN